VSLNGTPQLYTVYDGSNPYMDFNGSGQLTERYLYNPNALSQFYGQVSANDNVQWFLTDNINSIRQVVSANGTVLDAITYDPYGNIVNQTNAANASRFLYAGGAYDSLTGYDQFGRRYYNPSDGRWTSQDPLGLGPDSNLYRYVNNSPLNYVDNMGTAKFKVCNADYTDSTKAAEKLHFIETYIKTLEKSLNKLPQDEREQAIKEFKKFYNNIVKKTEAGVILDNCFTWCNIVDNKFVGFKVLRKYVKVKLVIWQYPPFPPFGFPYHRIAHGALKIILPDGTYFYVDNGWWGGVDYVNIGGPGFSGASSKTVETHIFIERDVPFYCSLKD
jgi:RHS repeat-associated protein